MVKPHTSRAGITLIELLCAISLLGVLVLYFDALEQIGRNNFRSMDRTIKVQNEAAYVLARMAQELRKTVGSPHMLLADGNPANPIYYSANAARKRIKFIRDSNVNGQWDGLQLGGSGTGLGGDDFGCFRYRESRTELEYRVYRNNNENNYRRSVNVNCAAAYNLQETLSENITDLNYAFIATDDAPGTDPMVNNFIQITVTVCYDVNNLATCGDRLHPENPQVTMTTRVAMPMVTVN